jgi:4-hydroxy 2-oxovalerate aldolase
MDGNKQIEILDCTLRDGSYINDSHFGTPAIKGIIKKLQDAHIDIIECGWLKDKTHEEGSAYYHIPSDIEPYLIEKSSRCIYVVMIDWNRYNTDNLPICDGKSIDAVRVVFPHGKHKEAIEVGQRIRDKGYKVFFQAANTLSYSDDDLHDLAKCMNVFKPVALSVVDTFGAMYEDDLDRIVNILNKDLDSKIKIGFHSHNNQQLSFALTQHFIDILQDSNHGIIADSSLSGMGRGAGNTTTELIISYMNKKKHGAYDLDSVMDAIDTYIEGFKQKYYWGYSTPYFIAGLYQCHVNNIAYLLNNHRTTSHDMRNIIASLGAEERRNYDYDLLESKYLENQNRIVGDEASVKALKKEFADRTVLLMAPGKSIDSMRDKIDAFVKEQNPVCVAVNAFNQSYKPDYVFLVNTSRYEYAKTAYSDLFNTTRKILLSNIKTKGDEDEIIVNFNRAIKRGTEHFDNAVICALRLMDKLDVSKVALAGFDGFRHAYNESYADSSLPTLNPNGKWDELNEEIKTMFTDFRESVKDSMKIKFITPSIYNDDKI